MHGKNGFVKPKNLIRLENNFVDRTHKLVAKMSKFVAALLIMLEILKSFCKFFRISL